MRRSAWRPVPLLLAVALLALGSVQLCTRVAAAEQADAAGDDEMIERTITTTIDDEEGGAEAGDAEQDNVDESDVLVLTDKSFDDAIEKHKNILVGYSGTAHAVAGYSADLTSI
jgi:hypothetical protein